MKPRDEIDISKLNRRQRRALKKGQKQSASIQWPDFMRGLSNHERMTLKKIGRGGAETGGRRDRNSKQRKV